MSEANKLSTYGVARKETTLACAVRLERMLTALAAIHPVFTRWNKQGGTEAEWIQPFCKMPPQIDELTKIFESGRIFTDASHALVPQLGYAISAWNGTEGARGVSMSIQAGAYTEQFDFPNMIDVEFDPARSDNADLINAKCLKAVFLTVVNTWEPSWASITNWDYWRPLFDAPVFPVFRSGWMTYLSAPYARKITPPPLAITEGVAGGGILMLATNDIFTVNNPTHVAVADAIQACLAPLQSNPRLRPVPTVNNKSDSPT